MLKVNSYSFKSFQQQLKPAQKPFNPNKLNIYYYNDTHGNSDQMAGILNSAHVFKQQNKDTVNFVLSAGDNTSGSDSKKNNFIFDLLKNIANIDASAVGNHEIDGGMESFIDAAKNEGIPFVATNVDFDDSHPLDDLIKKSFIKEQNGVKYGFIGAMPIDFKSCTKKQAQKGIEVMDFEESIEEMQEEINDLRKQGVNKIILLSHSGYEIDKKYAQNLDGVDIIVGGHSHSVVQGAKQNENVITSKSGEPVLVVQAGENGKYYGVLNVEFDDNGRLKFINNSLVENTNLKKSPVIEAIKSQLLGKSPAIATISQIDEMPKNRRIAPCAWTNLMADAMRFEMNCDVALINSANIRKVPQAGVLTERDVFETAPMKNDLLVTKVTQKQLVDAIKVAAKQSMTSNEGEPGLLQVSGLTYKINNQGDLLEMNFVDKNGNKTPININNPSETITYSAVYDHFVAQEDGEYPLMVPRFAQTDYNFDKDKLTCDYIAKLTSKNSLVVIDDKRIEIL